MDFNSGLHDRPDHTQDNSRSSPTWLIISLFWGLVVIDDSDYLPERFLTDGSGAVPFPSQTPHFACCVPLSLQRWHNGDLLAHVCPLPLQLEQLFRMDPVPLQGPHGGIIAVLYSHTCGMLCWLLTGAGLMCMLEGTTSRGNRG